MRTAALALALISLAATTAMAQVPRTINYQGRVNDASGALDGNHEMTMKLYTSQTGGTPLFTDVQTVSFKGGVFTVAIGGGPNGPIPATMSFDRQYWMGVTIQGVNGDQEITPRFILRSSPYSFRAALADSSANAATATHATTAGTLDLPAQFTGSGDNPLFEAHNTGKGAALRVEGGTYATISVGVDSTTKHFVSGETLGGGSIPAAGAYYRDNAPVAWGTVSRNGILISGFGMTVALQKDSTYEVTLINPMQTVKLSDFDVPQLAPVITPGGNSPSSESITPVFTSWAYKRDASSGIVDKKTIVVKFLNISVPGQNFASGSSFSIVVFGRP
jgi:hypothetical protein